MTSDASQVPVTQTEKASRYIHFSIERDGKEVGRARLFLIENALHKEPYGLLEDLFVDESYRGQGFAKQILEDVLTRAKEEHCYKLIATSRLEREKVHALYTRIGFVLHGNEFRMDL